MPDEADAFSLNYAQARAKFREAAETAGLQVTSYPLALPGRDGEALAVDAAWQGPRHAAKLLLLSNGVHGVEGYAGSATSVSAPLTGLVVKRRTRPLACHPKWPDAAATSWRA